MDVTDSDHKPVRYIFTTDIARVDESIRRQEFGEILGSNQKIKGFQKELCKIPETIISTNNIILQNQDTMILRITNKCSDNNAFFEIICEGQSTFMEDQKASNHQSRGSFGFPRWLEVIFFLFLEGVRTCFEQNREASSYQIIYFILERIEYKENEEYLYPPVFLIIKGHQI